MTVALHEMLIDGLPRGPFISTWRTTAANEKITLPLSGGTGSAYNCIVDWGDGTFSTITSATDPARIHTYATPGDYQVKISGTLTGWAFNNSGDRTKIRKIDNWGILRFTPTQSGHFNGCTNLTIPAVDSLVLSASCSSMFYGCTSIVTAPSLVAADTSGVTNMSSMFYSCSAFKSDLSAWNVSAVTNMSGMFQNCSVFNSNLSTWNVSAVTNMSSMFRGCSVFNSDISAWNVSAVTNMNAMFHSCSAFNSDLSTWNVSAVTNMGFMFYFCSAFNSDISAWNVSAVTNMNSMFYGCPVFNSDLSAWNVSAVTSMNGMFNGCSVFNCGKSPGIVHSLMQRTITGGWRIGGITSANLDSMFKDASAFAGDISSWCANAATTLPLNFALRAHANFTVARQPTWGACPIPD